MEKIEEALRMLREALQTTVPMSAYAESRINIAIIRLEEFKRSNK